MLRLIVDENVHGALIPGLHGYAQEQDCEVDVVSAVGVGLGARPDQEILEYAAQNERVVVTLDVTTLIGYANDRVRAGVPMPGVIVLRAGLASAMWIEHLVMTATCYDPCDMANLVRFLPEHP